MAHTRAIIDLNRLRQNIEAIRLHIGRTPAICLAVKADAYGHGAIPVAQAARTEGVGWFAVASAEEALELRSAGATGSILLLGVAETGEIGSLIEHDVSCVVGDREMIAAFGEAGRRVGRLARLHVEIDTGMGRTGCAFADAPDLVSLLVGTPGVELEGVCTHFASAEEDEEYTRVQLRRFNRCLDTSDTGRFRPIVHAANSAGFIGYEETRFDMVRAGIAAYGYAPEVGSSRSLDVEPVMTLVSRVVFVKQVGANVPISYGGVYRTAEPTTIATVAAGYADGYSRRLSNIGEVVIRGKRYRVSGRVCMDQFMVDLGPSSDVRPGDEVVLFGPEAPAANAAEVAEWAGTIPYEVICDIGKRVPRIYRG